MLSADPTMAHSVWFSQHRGATAAATDEAQGPSTAIDLSTLMSLRMARTAASGLV